MKKIYYILFILGVMLLCWLVPNVVNNKVNEDEIWWEEYQIKDGSYIRIIHAHDCKAKKPLIRWNVQCNMLDYYKCKYDVYDYCIDEDNAIMLNAISKRNIKYAMERQWAYAETEQDVAVCRRNDKMWDTTDRTYEVAYSLKGDELIPQNDNVEIIMDYSLKTHWTLKKNK